MPKSGLILLTTAGFDTGPFNLLSDADGFVTPFELNVPKSSLIAGYTTNSVPDAATVVRVKSNSSLCTNFIDLPYPVVDVTPTPTTTQTPTETNTPTPTPTGCACVEGILVEVTSSGTITYLDCEGNSGSIIVSIGPNVVGSGECIQKDSLGGTATFTIDTYGICCSVVTPTPTQTETPTQTPTVTQTQTNTPTTSATIGLTPTATSSNTPTPTETPTNTPTETPTNTPTETPTNTPTETPTNTPTETTTQTPTNTPTETSTQTPTQTQTPTVTPTVTSTPTSTPGYLVSFVDCVSWDEFRFKDLPFTLIIGSVYHITGSTEFEGCATVVSSGGGPIYDGTGVIFTQTASGCGDDICPRVSSVAALLLDCVTDVVFYANVDQDTAFVGAVYQYNSRCYKFVEFSGPGGPDLGEPDFGDCETCLLATPTPTPFSTPTVTPTVSSTPAPCSSSEFCFTTTLPSLVDYNGQYTSGSTYNGRVSYSGGSISIGYVYYFTSTTESYWCLSSSLGGTCLLRGSSPCYSQCPDISFGSFVAGLCPTPTPTPANCSTFDFNAYFDCDYVPVPTPSISVPCEDVNFDFSSIGVTPTPSPTGFACLGKSVNFVINEIPSNVTPTPTTTPTITLSRTVDASGKVTFGIFDETFSCVSVKVLIDCDTNVELYTNDDLIYNGIPINVGMVMSVIVNDSLLCVRYDRDDSNLSSNCNIDSILAIYGSECANCSNVPTATPTVTSTPTLTPSVTTTSTQTQTPSVTPTNTKTPTATATPGLTPTATPRPSYSPTPSPTTTPTVTPSISQSPTLTPTMTPTPNYVYVYSSCSPISPNVLRTYLIQTQLSPIQTIVGNQFKDNQGNCWTFEGIFGQNYIAPPKTISQTFTGDYFAGQPSIKFTSCTECQTIVLPPPNLIYFNAQRCDNQQNIIVSGLDLGPCQSGFNFQFSIGTLCVTAQVGETVIIPNPNGDDFCVKLLSITTAQPTPWLLTRPIYGGLPECNCSLRRVYEADACDGSEIGKIIYDSPTAPILSVGQSVRIDTSGNCFVIKSYNGVKSVINFIPGAISIITASFDNCESCIN